MKFSVAIMMLSLFLTHGFNGSSNGTPEFLSSQDTLLIPTSKHKGQGLFSLGGGFPEFKEVSAQFPYEIVLPEELLEIQRSQIWTDFRADNPDFVDIIRGKKGGKEVFVVDQNNNRDLTDDPIRLYEKINWKSAEGLIKCEFLLSNGQELVKDSSWLNLGNSNGRFLTGRSEHLRASFQLDGISYQLGIVDPMNVSSFTYSNSSTIALISTNSQVRDALEMKDIQALGEYVNLGGNYYRFESITNNGAYITLVKETEFEQKIGTQVGMLAPEFTAVSVSGDTIISSSLAAKRTVITNSCGCGGDKLSTQAYYNMKDRYGNKINLFRLDSAIDPKVEGIHIDMENDFNKNMYTNYRGQYCSRTTYVIDENKRVIDKFFVLDWETYLPKVIQE